MVFSAIKLSTVNDFPDPTGLLNIPQFISFYRIIVMKIFKITSIGDQFGVSSDIKCCINSKYNILLTDAD